MTTATPPLDPPRVTVATLASLLFSPIAGALDAFLGDHPGSHLILIEKPFADPLVGDWLVHLFPGIPGAERFQWAGTAEQPRVFDARALLRDAPADADAIATLQGFAGELVEAQRQAQAAGRSVIVLVKRCEAFPQSLAILPLAPIVLPRINTPERLYAACEALFDGFAGHRPLDWQTDAWVRQLVPSDFLACAQTPDEAVFAALRARVEARLAELTTPVADVPLTQFEGADAIQAWADEVRALLADDTSEASQWAWVSPGILLTSPERDRCAQLARALADHCAVPFVSADGDALLHTPGAVVERARDHAPCLLFLRGTNWHASSLGDDPSLPARRQKALEALQGIPVGDVLLVAEVDEVGDSDAVAEPWRQPPLFERSFHAPAVPVAFWGARFLELLPADECAPTLLDPRELGRIGTLVADLGGDGPTLRLARFLRRQARRGARLIGIDDLLDAVIRGTVEDVSRPADSSEYRRAVAYHEAGHALLTLIGSNGQTIPDYSTIVPSSGRFEGVVWRFSGNTRQSLSVADFRKQIRIMLAGRAAEEVLAGPDAITGGAASDLASATRMARYAFAFLGFAPTMDQGDASGANLAVALTEDDLARDHVRLNSLVRDCLAREYEVTRALLIDHRPLLDALATRLLNDPIVDQGEMREIYQRFAPPAAQ